MVHSLLEDPLVLEQRGGDLHSRKSNMGVFFKGEREGWAPCHENKTR